jgi:hypothetical protein
MAFLKRGTGVEVFWIDAEADSGWGAVRSVAAKASDVKTLGYVIHDNDVCIAVAGDIQSGEPLTEDSDVNRVIIIPKGMVTKVRKLP